MKLGDILDYFGPKVWCRVKVRCYGEDNYCYEKDDDYPEDEDLLNAYVMEISIDEDEEGSFLKLDVEK